MKLLKVADIRLAMQERPLPALNQHILSALMVTTLYFSFTLKSNFEKVLNNLDYFYLGDSSPTQDKHILLGLNTGFVTNNALFPVVVKKANTLAELVVAPPITTVYKINYELGTITLLEDPRTHLYVSVEYASGFDSVEDKEIDINALLPVEILYGFSYTGIPDWLTQFSRLHAIDSFRQIKDWAGDAKQGAVERLRKPSVIAPPDKTFHQMLLEPHLRILPTALWPINR